MTRADEAVLRYAARKAGCDPSDIRYAYVDEDGSSTCGCQDERFVTGVYWGKKPTQLTGDPAGRIEFNTVDELITDFTEFLIEEFGLQDSGTSGL